MLLIALRVLESLENPRTILTNDEIELLKIVAEERDGDFTAEEIAWFVIEREINEEWPDSQHVSPIPAQIYRNS